MRNAHCRTWIMVRKLTNKENEKHTLRNSNMARKSEKREKREIHNVGPGIWQEN